ncbi:DNA-cytosine methyltransferase family protein [Brevibacillus laterosporus GI-9]|uniref:DNA cytosine methyltransferase n=1 Tax=Brevibacillus laterosporus TaxID=1465 RepID=UPI00024054B5|nr:DNA cytosine methyltransferase [Brevibacillus laterosporus]CCF16892.1 DNA-cytosine methyltransferase family protein [Brevibacillus laterosporus GI-9]
MYTVLDLFCGAGGMSEGFLQAGFEVPFASDYSKEAAETYTKRHQQLGYDLKFFNDDIGKLTKRSTLNEFLGDTRIDVIVGGPPCQGFSLTGKRDENDPRNKLFLDYLKIVKMVKPKYFVIENVEGILSYKVKKLKGISGTIYEDELVPNIIQKETEKFGYFVEHKLLNAKDYGVPQNRPRVIFFGTRIIKNRKNKLQKPKFPEKQNLVVTVEDAISDLRFLKNGQESANYNVRYNVTAYQQLLRNGITPSANGEPIPSIELHNHKASKHQDKTVKRFEKLKSGESVGQLLERLTPEELEYFNTKKYRCAKLEGSSVSPTVLTLPDDIVHYDKGNPRILTVREFARLQSFDDSFVFYGKRTTGGDRRKFETPQYTQVGNAVPPLFARAIANEILLVLNVVNNNGLL